jgi:diaminopimelate epimerase
MSYLCTSTAMQIEFHKYQGTGNDFILVDNRRAIFPKKDTKLVKRMCDRRFGIGGDGLILLENDSSADFNMVYYNADGKPGSLCGNGGRCIVSFANYLGIIGSNTRFRAVDGLHDASIEGDNVSLKMNDVADIRQKPQYLFLDTGSPHHVQLVEGLDKVSVQEEGARLRYGLYGKKGSNINFVEPDSNALFSVRTYERGVEGETLSCGTGVTAVALGMFHLGKTDKTQVEIKTRGGRLQVNFEPNGTAYRNIYLKGPAIRVFRGTWDVES